MKKTYTKEFKCSQCVKIVGKFNEESKCLVIKSYTIVCMVCLGKLLRLNEKWLCIECNQNKKGKNCKDCGISRIGNK